MRADARGHAVDERVERALHDARVLRVRAHELHHRKPNTNYAQYVMFWDRLMGTYHPYVDRGDSNSAKADARLANGNGLKAD